MKKILILFCVIAAATMVLSCSEDNIGGVSYAGEQYAYIYLVNSTLEPADSNAVAHIKRITTNLSNNVTYEYTFEEKYNTSFYTTHHLPTLELAAYYTDEELEGDDKIKVTYYISTETSSKENHTDTLEVTFAAAAVPRIYPKQAYFNGEEKEIGEQSIGSESEFGLYYGVYFIYID